MIQLNYIIISLNYIMIQLKAESYVVVKLLPGHIRRFEEKRLTNHSLLTHKLNKKGNSK